MNPPGHDLHETMWETPIYRYELRRKGPKGKKSNEQIIIDVTDSAPTMDEPGVYLESVFNALLKGRNPKETRILDFGAGKMRNTLFLLKKGYQVYAVEFPELPKRKPQAKVSWEAVKKYPNFKKLVFPRDFYELDEKMDLVLLVNVLNVMPVPFERLAALALCRRRMKEGGLGFWFNWKPASSDPIKYSGMNRLNDGWYCGKGHKVKTFHVEWSRGEAFEMMAATGFSPSETTEIERTSGSQSYVFVSDRPILIENELQLAEIERGGFAHNQESILEELQPPNILRLYLDELKVMPTGDGKARQYQHTAMRIFAGVFDSELKNPRPEAPIDEGRGFIDIRFQNRNEPGFFKNAKEMHDIKCPTIPVECKNYSEDVSSREFDQLSGRMDNPDRGMLGILACRKVSEPKSVLKRSRDKAKSHKFIIVLEDSDLERLVKSRLSDDKEEIDDYMERKLNEIID